MSQKQAVEFVELDPQKKWEFLKRYYDVAKKFYDYQENVVTDEEINACINKFKEKPRPKIRKEIQLKTWKFKLDTTDVGVQEGYFAYACDDHGWEDIQTPHSYRYIPDNPVRFGNSFQDLFGSGEGKEIWYATYGNWYRHSQLLDPIRENEIAFLKFDSVDLTTDVWVNENPVMLGHLGLFPFEMEVTEEIKAGRENQSLITVRAKAIVTNKPWLFYNGYQSAYINPPYTAGRLQEDWRDEASPGIAGDASLLVLNQNHIQDVFLFTQDIVENEAVIICQVNLRNTSWERFIGKVQLEISPWLPNEGETVQQISADAVVLPMNDGKMSINFTMKDPLLWAFEHPNMYLAHIVLIDGEGKEIDDLFETFGVRTIKIVGTNFYLNNEIIYPMGTHDICHYFNEPIICPSDYIIVKDLLLHKKMGANCSRWPSDSRIHYKRIAEYCNQLGYMLSWTGYFEVWTVHPEMEMYASRDVKAMIRSLRNCPSIIIWEMGDEPLLDVHHYRRYKWYELVYNLVKAEDESRPILPAGHFAGELLKLFKNRKDTDRTSDEIRKDILRDYPIYNLELAYWDFHSTFMLFPIRPFYNLFNSVKEAFGGQRLAILTEFGIDALPELSKVLDVYGKFRWGANPLWYRNRKEDDLAFYGREITAEDWQETQASQALCLSNAIDYIRESPETFAGFYFMMMIDYWTYYQGVVDANGNCKLAYSVVKNLCQPITLSGMHGNTVIQDAEPIEIIVSNLGQSVEGAFLNVEVKDMDECILLQKSFHDLDIKGRVNITKVAGLSLGGLKPGLYQIEYLLNSAEGQEISRMVELFFME